MFKSIISSIAGASKGAAGTAATGVPKEGAPPKSQITGLIQEVVGLANESKNLVKDVLSKTSGMAGGAMDKASAVVKNDANGLIQEMEFLPDGVKKFSQALTGLTNSIVESGRHLGMYNGDLARSSAMADVKQMQTEIRESNYVGKSYANVIDKKAEFDSKFSTAMNPVKDAVAEATADMLEKLNAILDIINKNSEYVAEGVSYLIAFYQFINLNFDGMNKTLNAIPEKMAKAITQKTDEVQYVKEIFKNSTKNDLDLQQRDIPLPGPLNMGMNFANFG
jgi:hypothetical protein